MAARTLYPSQEATMNWSASEWSLADDNAKDQAKPAAGQGDTVIFTANSTAAMAVDEATAVLSSLTTTGYTGTITANNDITVTGGANSVVLGSGTSLVGTSKSLIITDPTANDFLDCSTATVTVRIRITLDAASRSNAGTISGYRFRVQSNSSKTLTQSGAINITDFSEFFGTANSQGAGLVLGAADHVFEVISLGITTGTGRYSSLDLGTATSVSCVSLASLDNTVPNVFAINGGTADFLPAGAFDLAGISVTTANGKNAVFGLVRGFRCGRPILQRGN